MKAKKAIKKIVALGMGATMVGATLLGASAADLGNYPDQFVKDGQFDGLLVVGEEADSVDTIGSINVAMGLQAASVSETTVCDDEENDSSSVSVEDGVEFETSSEKLYKYKTLGDIKPTLDETDLPNLLADGTYSDDDNNDEDFSQKINMPTKELEYTGDAPDIDEDDTNDEQGVSNLQERPNLFLSTYDEDGADPAGYYMKMPKDKDAYEYVLDFDNPVDISNEENLESTTIEIQGNMYTILDASKDGDALDELEMLVGDRIEWITQDETITFEDNEGTEREVKMIDVTAEDEAACGLEIDGSMHWIDQDDTTSVDGLNVGVIDAKPVHTKDYDADICKITLGAKELNLKHEDEVELDGDEIEGSTAKLQGESEAVGDDEWSGITIDWAPEDTTYLPFDADTEERQLEDPVFGNFKYVAGGVEEDTEDIEYSMSSSSGEISFVNSDGKEVVVPFAEDGDVYLGDDSDIDDQIYWNGEAGGTNTCDGDGDVTDCEDARWLISQNGEAHIIELSGIDYEEEDDEYTIDVEDTVYDRSTDDAKVIADSNGDVEGDDEDGQFYMSGVGTISVDIVDADGTIAFTPEGGETVDGDDGIETEYGMKLTNLAYDTSNGELDIEWTEEEAPENDVAYHQDDEGDPAPYGAASVANTISVDDDDLKLGEPSGLTLGDDSVSYSSDNEDLHLYSSVRGTVAAYESDDEDEQTIMYPGSDVYGEVYMAPTVSELSESEGGENCYTTDEVNKIPSTVNKFDTEVDDPTDQNIITVGGPCANSVTSALMGDPEDCSEGFESGMALLKMVENGDNTALIVAGGEGKDTRIASTVLQDFEEYADELSGDELKLTTVSESNIGFESVDEEEDVEEDEEEDTEEDVEEDVEEDEE